MFNFPGFGVQHRGSGVQLPRIQCSTSVGFGVQDPPDYAISTPAAKPKTRSGTDATERHAHLGHLLQARKQSPDVYQFETLPGPLRVQIQRIIRNMFTLWDSRTADPGGLYSILHEALAQEYGIAVLADGKDAMSRVQAFLAKTADIEQVLDAIEVALRLADQYHEDMALLDPSEAVKELNHRFREHGVGYQIEGSKAIRVDSTYIHKEAMRPALTVLRAQEFENAEAEFRKAHEHYRHRRYGEANAGCLMALESTLKVICHRRGWQFDGEKHTAKALIDIVFKEGLIPDYMRSQFGALRSVL